jgi:hypothetical protein
VLGIPIAMQLADVPAEMDPERPMKVDVLSFKMYKIWQDSSLPCDRNTISVTLETDKTNFLDVCSPRVTVTGLQSSLSTPASGQIDLVTHWLWTSNGNVGNTEVVGRLSSAGDLVVKMPAGPSNNWKMHFELDNPKAAQSCRTTRLKISMESCLSNEQQIWPSAQGSLGAELSPANTYREAPLLIFGVGKVANEIITRSQEDLCPLFIRNSGIGTKDIGQSSPYPCDINVLTVTLSVQLPMIDRPEYPSICKPCITIMGLKGSQTDDGVIDITVIPLQSENPLVSSGRWTRNTGNLELSIKSNAIFVAGLQYRFSFSLVNQAQAQCPPSPSIQTCMDASTPMVTDGTTLLNKPGAIIGDARPFTILRSNFVTKNIGQTVPFPGCLNTIIVTVSFNLPAFPENCNTFIRISGLQEANSHAYLLPPLDGSLQLSGEMHKSANSWSPGFCDSNQTIDSLVFQDAPAGTLGFATWQNQKSGSTVQCRRLTAYFSQVTTPGKEYVFQFQVTNPVGQTRSPPIYLEGKMQDLPRGQNAGTSQFFGVLPQNSRCIAHSCSEDSCLGMTGTSCKHVMRKDSSSLLCCTQCSYAGSAVASDQSRPTSAPDGQMTDQGDAEPFKVHTPFFCVKKIGQSSCYPCDSNKLTVTLTSNAGMKAGGTTVTITKLNRANRATGTIPLLDGPNSVGSHMFFSSSFTGVRGEAHWNNQLKSLTLFVVRDIECTAEIQLSFELENPSCEQDAQPVSIEASNIGNVPNVLASGVNIASSAMDHDVKTRPAGFWASTTVRGFAEGDAGPLKVCKLEILSAVVAGSSNHPCDSNQITVRNMITNVPILKTNYCTPAITVR